MKKKRKTKQRKKRTDEGMKQSRCDKENTKEEEEEKEEKETAPEPLKIEEMWEVGTLKMRRRRKSGQVRQVNSVGHLSGLGNGKS